MLASFKLLVDFNAVSWEGVKFRGRACQRRDLSTYVSVYHGNLFENGGAREHPSRYR
jgi:hypothetical protein